MKTETLYGIHPVSEALRAGRRSFVKIYVSAGKTTKRIEEISSLAGDLEIPVARATTHQLKSMTGTESHQGVGARVSPYAPLGLSDIVTGIDTGKRDPYLLLLDNVMDPNNLGAIIRTALCVGVDGILIPRDRSAPPTPAVSKASAGALEHAKLARVTNMVNSIKTLKEKGLWIVGMDRAAEKSIFSVDFTGPVAIVVGGEDKGIRSLVKKHCDFLVSIPQRGRIDSLNASAAGAIAMYEAVRQREFA